MKGQKISDRYQIIKSIGEGGMANVYLAYDTILDRNVAVKVLRGDLANDEKFVRRFQREALSASSLTHPNIVEVYDVGEDNGQYYIVMEYVEGKHLKNLIKKRGKLTVSEVIDIMLQITDGMSVAHDSYIIHRDIKPQNIMILENGLVKIMDFGIAMAMNSTQLTQTNSVMGSVHYLPPEQANGKGSTLQSDIYSMGIVMYELLTGSLPYKGDNAVEIALKHLKEPLPSIRDIVPNIPQSIENIIIKATAKNPKNRYADAREMHTDLLTCLDEERANEPKIVLPYPEVLEDSKLKTVKKPEEGKQASKEKKEEKEKEEVFAKQITKNDMKKSNSIMNKILIALAFVFTLLVIGITTVVVLLPIITSRKVLTIPDVTGYSVEDALQTLQDAGFMVATNQEHIASEDIAYGKVVKTSPLANTKRTSGTEVTLWISEGDTKITLENYVGFNVLEVQGRLDAQGINVIIEKRDVTDKKEENIILEQNPAPGQKVSKGDYVTLYIPNVDKYPNFANGSYTYEDVVEYLKKYNIVINKIEAESDKTPGIVIGQSREEGSPIVGGTSITITVAKAKTSNKEENSGGCEESGLC